MLRIRINTLPLKHWTILPCLLSLLYLACVPQVREMERGPGPTIRVLLATIDSRDTISFKGAYILQSEEAQYVFGQKNSDLYIHSLADGLQLYNDNRNLLYRNVFPVILRPEQPDSRFTYHGSDYYGSVYFQQAPDNRLYLINELLLENYLKGVVPAEIPANSEVDFEAIKAQAICARTYAFRRLENDPKKLYDVQATIADQVYAGLDHHTRLADRAIDETAGVIISYQGQPATVYYHSTCGGELEAAKNIFTNDDLPYLRGGTDAVGNTFSCSISPYFRWEERRSFEELDDTFSKFFNKSRFYQVPVDTLLLTYNLQISGRDSSGRVSDMIVSYADTTVLLNGYQIRRFLAGSGKSYLPSNLFYLRQLGDSTLVIHGAGYGHGVGLCQFGALFMSRRGFQHYHILSKYFPQTKLLRKY